MDFSNSLIEFEIKTGYEMRCQLGIQRRNKYKRKPIQLQTKLNVWNQVANFELDHLSTGRGLIYYLNSQPMLLCGNHHSVINRSLIEILVEDRSDQVYKINMENPYKTDCPKMTFAIEKHLVNENDTAGKFIILLILTFVEDT